MAGNQTKRHKTKLIHNGVVAPHFMKTATGGTKERFGKNKTKKKTTTPILNSDGSNVNNEVLSNYLINETSVT
ncbi:putative radial spoke domain-containing protein [Candida maltosa Xu316]|uniref:Putative radial spoke domain-containing protein n=1 Tax=Candida maltosa (strain Xu316) TaxID=1245528 RepID=M3IUZ4_CANMX|nr:putative radial spoke domain-containing protein [Candida maltosa Xu316]